MRSLLRFLWSNTHQLFYMYGNIDSYRRYRNIPFNLTSDVLMVSHGSKMSCYVSEADFAHQVVEGALFLDRAAAEHYIRDALAQCDAHEAFYASLPHTYVGVSDSAMLDLWRNLMDQYSHSAAYFRSTQEEPTRQLVEMIAQECTAEEFSELLLSPDLDAINEEEVAFEQLVRDGFTKEDARTHLHHFPWLFQNTLSYEETVEELAQRSQKHMVRDIREEKHALAERQQRILDAHPHITGHVKTLHDLALLRPRVKACWAATGFFALPMLKELSARKGIELKTLVFDYRFEDVENVLAHGLILSNEELAKRRQCCAYRVEDGNLSVCFGDAAEYVEQELLGGAAADENVSELRGMCARPGTVTAVAHVLAVNDPEATRRFRDTFNGGVLVTSMTQPNVVDIARRASAIVTDEGGMLCHAAIISREFGIPCIVGTHIATQVLKDGDMVEVDAGKGVVRIVERA